MFALILTSLTKIQSELARSWEPALAWSYTVINGLCSLDEYPCICSELESSLAPGNTVEWPTAFPLL